jgi:hypothetical protein
MDNIVKEVAALPRMLFRALVPGLLVTAVALAASVAIYWVFDPAIDWRSLALMCLFAGGAIIVGLVYRPENRLGGTAPGYTVQDAYIEQASRAAVGKGTAAKPLYPGSVTDIMNLVPIGIAAAAITISGLL